MTFNLIALAVCLFMTYHGFIAFRAGMQKVDKTYFFTIPNLPTVIKPYVQNLFFGALELLLAVCGLFIYTRLIFFT